MVCKNSYTDLLVKERNGYGSGFSVILAGVGEDRSTSNALFEFVMAVLGYTALK